MAQKSKAVLLVELKKMDRMLEEVDSLVESEASKLPKELRDQFEEFFNGDYSPSLEFFANWDSNVEFKNAISAVFNRMADETEKGVAILRALAE